MNKPLPWNVKGVGFDAREAARIAAKRAGIPLGEWLNGVISARAAELGVQVDDVEADDRLEAIAARLSQDGPMTGVGDAAGRRVLQDGSSRHGEAVPMIGDGDLLEMSRGPAGRPEPEPNDPSGRQPSAAAKLATVEDPTLPAPTLSSKTAPADADTSRPWPAEPFRPEPRRAATSPARGSRPRKPSVAATQLDARLASVLEKLNRSFSTAEELAKTVPAPHAVRRDARESSDVASAAPADPGPLPAAAMPDRGHGRGERRTPSRADAAPHDDFADLHAAFKDLARKLDRQDGVPQAAEARAAADDLAAEVAALGERVDRLRAPAPAGQARLPELQTLRREMAQLSANLSLLAPQRSLTALEDAVRELAGRVDLSRLDGVQDSVLAPVERLGREMREALRGVDAGPAVEALRRDMAALAGKMDTHPHRVAEPGALDALRRDLREMREAVGGLGERLGATDRLQGEVVALGDRVGTLAERTSPAVARELSAAVGDIRNLLRGFLEEGPLGALDQKIESLSARVETLAGTQAPKRLGEDLATLSDRIGTLSGKIDAVSRSSTDVNALYGLVGTLADRLDEARGPQVGADTMDALQAQIGTLVERLDRTATTDAGLRGLERLMGDLFLQVEQSRNAAIDAAENAARAAAQDTLRAAMDNPSLNGAELTVQTGLDVDHVSQELADLRRVQEASDHRVNATLTALNATLERLVDRLVAEGEKVAAPVEPPTAAKAGRRRGRVPPEPSVDERDMGGSLPAFDPEQFLLEPGAAGPQARRSPEASLAGPSRTADPVDPATDVAPLIAAARRAAQAAQASALEASLKVDAPVEAGVPAGKTRSFFASKRRALLLGLAGLVLALGTLQVVRLSASQEEGATAVPPSAETTAPDAAAAASPPPAAPDPAPAAREAAPVTPPAPPPAPAPAPTNGASLLTPPATADKVSVGFAIPTPGAASAPAAAGPADPALAGLAQGLKDLAAGGNAAAQYEVGARLADGRGVTRDARQAFAWFQRAALQGSAPAQYRLGSLYEKGVGVAADPALAIAWYEKAAGQGNVRAMHNLAVMSAEGAGGKPDYGKAVTWFTKAASYGVRDSQFNLAVLFARGLGVPQSLSQSYAWFAVAAQQGDGDAVSKRDTVAAKLDAKALTDAKATVASFRPLTPDTAANDVSPPPGGWEAAAPSARTAGRKSEARVSSM